MKKKILIFGKVHNVGYRSFLLDYADYLFIRNFDAQNIFIGSKEALNVLIEGKMKNKLIISWNLLS